MECTVLNLSSYILSDLHIYLLSKGLSFSPTTKFDIFQTLLDVNRLARFITLKNYFANQDNRSEQLYDSVAIDSIVTPK